MTRLLLLFSICFFCLNFSQAQQVSTPLIDCQTNHPTEWTIYKSTADFRIEYKFINCDPEMGYDFETVILRFTNLTSEALDFSWHIDIYREGHCGTCAHLNEYMRSIILDPGQVIEGDCVRNVNIQLKVFSEFNDADYTLGRKLSGFQLSDLIVKGMQ